MGKEVSCRASAFILEKLKDKGFSQENLLEGIPYDLDYLKNKHERIEWTIYCRFLKNLALVLDDDDLYKFGQSWVKSKYFRPWAIMIRIVLNLGKSLPLAQKMMNNAGSQFFSAIEFLLEDVGPNGFKIRLKMKDDYEFCPEHFYMVKGSLSVIPAIKTYQVAQVNMRWIKNGAMFEVIEPQKLGMFSWLYKKIFWLFTARTTMNEIIDAHDALILRYQELDRAREELAKFSQRLIELREQERQRIANELHDDISGNLSTIALLGEALESKRAFSEDERRRLKEIPRLARITAESMRDIVWFINPQNDDMEKLLAKMRETANLMLESLEFTFTAPEKGISLESDLDFRRNLYLFYKECLQNIIKHSRAQNVNIEIQQKGHCLQLRIVDNGEGFHTAEVYSGSGLKNMQQRAADMGGECKILSEIGKGTTVVLTTKIP